MLFCVFVVCLSLTCGNARRQGSSKYRDLSHRVFINEMATVGRTDATAHFDGYTPGSYHVDKFDLLEGMRLMADSLTKKVDAVLIFGPVGPLWQYDIVTVIDSLKPDSLVNINHLVFPHARITNKSTKKLERVQYRRCLDGILSNPILKNVPDRQNIEYGEWLCYSLLTYSVRPIRSGS